MNPAPLAAPATRAHGGRFVELAEMVAFAKPGHGLCRGLGYIVMLVKKERQFRPCRCATKRFYAVHAPHVYDNAGTIFWHPDHVPAAVIVSGPATQ